MQQLLQSGEQGGVRMRVAEQRRPRRPQRALRRREVAGLAEQMPQALQHAGGNAVARRGRVVAE
jgi:hypothetical protein